MPVNDPIGDMLTRIRNGGRAHHDQVVMPSSKMKVEIARCLKDEGFIADYVLHERHPQNELTVLLKYGPDRSPVIQGIHRVSKPGLRKYASVREIPRVRGGLGISIVSTSQGILVDEAARKQKLGGEILCVVY